MPFRGHARHPGSSETRCPLAGEAEVIPGDLCSPEDYCPTSREKTIS